MTKDTRSEYIASLDLVPVDATGWIKPSTCKRQAEPQGWFRRLLSFLGV